LEYRPAAHAMQLLPPGFTPVSVLDPAGHAVQTAVVPAPAPAYDPAGHAPKHSAVVWLLKPYRPALHGEHEATFETVEYCPAAHAMQLLPPVLGPMSVLDPARHGVQLGDVPAPAPAYDPAGHAPLHAADVPAPLSAYRPALQGEHEATFETLEYRPAAHAMQLLPPGFTPVSVLDPTGHAMHSAVVPAPAPAYDPAGHAPKHSAVVWLLKPYRPALHGEHEATFETLEYRPAAHAMQLLPPGFTPVSVLDPAGHAVQTAVVPAPTPAYDPAGHAPLHAADVPAPVSA
jgi:hypothetical protein